MTPKQLKAFKEYIFNAGGELLSPTNEYEVIRFKGNGKIGVVYQNSAGRITKYVGEAQIAHENFMAKKAYKCTQPKKRVKRPIIYRSLLERDGSNCFYCGQSMDEGSETIEHLFSIKQGGSNHINNLALAHASCNLKAANKSVVEKIKLRDELRCTTT